LLVPEADDRSELELRLAEVEALRRRVLNVIPHALRTPITTFRGLSEALVTATDTEIRDEIGPALRRLAAQAEHLLDDLLIAAGYTTALPTTPVRPTDIEPVVRTVWRELGGGEADLEFSGRVDRAVAAPEGSLFKVLVHVLDNAHKYGEGRVRVDIDDAADAVAIEISTSGDTPGDLSMLAEPFYRGEAAVMRSAGLGVGLTVAQALAEQAGGSLTVREGEGGGVCCRVELPAAPAPARSEAS
jgi:K+-sensing histidine kinase KdpD